MTQSVDSPGAATRPRRPWLALALWAGLIAVALAVIVRTPFVADLSAFLPARPDAGQRVLMDQLQSGVAARTLLLGIDGGNAEQRAQASRALAQAMRSSGHFEQVQNGGTDGFAAVGSWILDHRYLLSPAVNPARFTAEGLRDGIDETLSLLGTPAGNAIKPLLERDPTGETLRIAEALLPTNAPRQAEGVWVSRQTERAVLLATVSVPGADLDGQAAALDSARQAFATVQTQVGADVQPPLELRLSGSPVFSVESRARIEREVRLLAVAGTVMISALLWLAFASLPALLVALLPVATGVVTGIAAVGLGFGNVHGVTLGFGSTLMGEAVDYAIYYLIQSRDGPSLSSQRGTHGPQAGWQHWVRNSWPTVRLGLLTSVCGFAVLAFSGFPGLAQLGVFSTAGLVAAALTTRFVLPVLMPHGAPGRGARRRLGEWASRAVGVLPRLRPLILGLGVAAATTLLWQGKDLWRADLASLSPISAEAIALNESLRADLMDSEGGALVVVQAPTAEAALVQAERVATKLDGLVNAGQLAGYNSVTRWLPSVATQRRRLAALPDETSLRTALQQATADGPLPAQRLSPFLAEVQAARGLQPVTAADLQGTALSPLVDALLMQNRRGGYTALLPAQWPVQAPAEAANNGTTASIEVLRSTLKDMPGVQLLDVKPELDRLYNRYLGEAQTQTLLGAAAVIVVIALWLRSPRRLLAVCQPLALSVVLTLGLLAAFQVPLGILHLVGLLLVVAVGSNYALFFDMLQHGDDAKQNVSTAGHGESVDDTLPSLLLANLTTVLSFGLIALSSIPALSAVGRVVAPGALLALVLAAAFVPRVPKPL